MPMFRGCMLIWGGLLCVTPAQSVPDVGLNDEAHRQCQHLCGAMHECARKRYSAVPRDMWKTYGYILNNALIDIQSTCVAGCHIARVDHNQVNAGEEEGENVADDA